MNVVIVIMIIIQIITCIIIFMKHKNNKKYFSKMTVLKMKHDILDMKTELSDIKMELTNTTYKLSVSTRMIDRLIDNVDILDVDDIEMDYSGVSFHYNQKLTGTSNTKYITNTFVRIEDIIYVITEGSILDDNKYKYDLLYVKGGIYDGIRNRIKTR